MKKLNKLLKKTNSLYLFFIFFLISAKTFSYEKMIVIKDLKEDKIIFSEGNCNTRYSPCSTFKIAISLMGYDSQILISENYPVLKFKEENFNRKKLLTKWKKDHSPNMWMKNSCVWFSQEIVNQLGNEKFLNYIKLFSYGNQHIQCDKEIDLLNVWLCKSLEISSYEQIQFLEKLLREEFKISSYATKMTKNLLFIEKLSNGWSLYGKTGTGYNNSEFGWFVGWVNKDDKTIVFSSLVVNDVKDNVLASLRAKHEIQSFLTDIE